MPFNAKDRTEIERKLEDDSEIWGYFLPSFSLHPAPLSASRGPGDVNSGEPDTVGTVGSCGPKESGSNAGCGPGDVFPNCAADPISSGKKVSQTCYVR